LNLPGNVLSAMHKLLLCVLARFGADDGTGIYPSVATVAGLIGRTESQTHRIIDRLIADGWLERVRKGGGVKRADEAGRTRGVTSEYRINLDRVETLAPMRVLQDGKDKQKRNVRENLVNQTGNQIPPHGGFEGGFSETLASDPPNTRIFEPNTRTHATRTLAPMREEAVEVKQLIESVDRNPLIVSPAQPKRGQEEQLAECRKRGITDEAMDIAYNERRDPMAKFRRGTKGAKATRARTPTAEPRDITVESERIDNSNESR
jgi:hypothetical protein